MSVAYTVPQARKDARAAMEALDIEYRNTAGIPERFELKLKALHQPGKESSDTALAYQVQRLKDSYFVYLLAAWGRGDIVGKGHVDTKAERVTKLEAKIRSQLALAQSQEDDGKNASAKGLRKSVKKLQKELGELQATPEVQP